MRSCCRQTSSLVARRLRSSRANLILAQLEIRRTSREKPSETLDALGAQPVLNNLFEALSVCEQFVAPSTVWIERS
jgi:hypothetical protein